MLITGFEPPVEAIGEVPETVATPLAAGDETQSVPLDVNTYPDVPGDDKPVPPLAALTIPVTLAAFPVIVTPANTDTVDPNVISVVPSVIGVAKLTSNSDSGIGPFWFANIFGTAII
jgi:hypothetical protein